MTPSQGLTPELLLHAYSNGIFPMSEGRDTDEVFWVDPRKRGVFPLDGFRISRSLRRAIRTSPFRITFDTDFSSVVAGCADREETWINGPITRLYAALADAGFAHSVEVWDEQRLVGGVYGVTIGAAFFGESMFSTRTNASKIALAYLIDKLRSSGFVLFDTQFITDHLSSLGAIEIPRGTYRRYLAEAIEIESDFDTNAAVSTPDQLLQRMTQTS
ncbi:MAG: leucyl/phenylalanyl-tRNA--protein transferase [Paracoccaceae bacterium]|nr:leucyl/phenylalanyl-tRNA--protein transferase [Paracoccaceae bacterium]